LRGDDPSLAAADVARNFSTVMPSMLLQYTLPDHKSLRIYYRTSTVAPSVTQLQQVVNNSNPLLLSTGNPDLVQSYSHMLLARYSLTNPDQATSMFLLVSGAFTPLQNFLTGSSASTPGAQGFGGGGGGGRFGGFSTQQIPTANLDDVNSKAGSRPQATETDTTW
jgi:hypothetical protein